MNITQAKTIQIGSRPISAVYLGTQKIWPKLPYTPLSYVTFNGSATIRTDIVNANTPTIICDCQPTNGALFGASNGANIFALTTTIGSWYDYMILSGTPAARNIGTASGRLTVNVTGTTATIGSITATIRAPATNNSLDLGSVSGQNMTRLTGNIYSFQILKSGVLVCDMIPAQYNGVVGMWDRARQQFYPPIVGTLTGA